VDQLIKKVYGVINLTWEEKYCHDYVVMTTILRLTNICL